MSTPNPPISPTTTLPVAAHPAGIVPSAPTVPATPPNKPKDDLAALLDEPAERQWYRRPKLWIIALAVLLIAGGVWYWQAKRNANTAPIYSTQPVTRGDLTLTVTANGTLQPTRSTNIGSELSGTVLKVNVDVNDQITKRQVLVELDTAKLKDQVLRSRATVAAATAKVTQTTATVEEARATLARFDEVSRLSSGKVPAKTELDTARATLGRASSLARRRLPLFQPAPTARVARSTTAPRSGRRHLRRRGTALTGDILTSGPNAKWHRRSLGRACRAPGLG